MTDVMQAPQQATAPQSQPQKNVEEALDRLLAVASAGAVFGQPITQGDTTIVPCSEVAAGIGLGGGTGYGPDSQGRGQTGGGGSGGGGGARGRPVAAIVITPQGVRVEPSAGRDTHRAGQHGDRRVCPGLRLVGSCAPLAPVPTRCHRSPTCASS